MNGQVAVAGLRRAADRSVVRDAALAGGLVIACLLVNDPPPVGTAAGRLGEPVVVVTWWTATAVIIASVVGRRRWPVSMVMLCTVAVGTHLALTAPPMLIDAGVLVVLSAVAVHRGRAVSLAVLGGLLLVVAGWSVYQTVNELPRPVFAVNHRPARSAPVGDPGATGRIGGPSPWSGLSVLGSSLVAAWAIGSGVRSRRAYLDQLHARAQDLQRERDQQAALAVAAERSRISREMHDVVAHGLSIIVIQAQGAAAALDSRPADTRTALEAIVKTGRDSLADMRRTLTAVGQADDTWQPPPGLGQLPALLERVRGAGTPVRLRIEGAPGPLPATVDLSAYRIIQEALTNTMKHATDAAADVTVTYRNTELSVQVTDDGPTVTGNRTGAGEGNGLRGMHERVKLLGGRLAAEPHPEGGFVVRATLPIHGQHA